MKKIIALFRKGGKMTTYIFKVEIEEDRFDDGRMAYHAYCPCLKGATTWGYTEAEALKNLREVVEMTVESMIEHGERNIIQDAGWTEDDLSRVHF